MIKENIDMRKIIFLGIAMILAVYTLYRVYESKPSQKIEEKEGTFSENWKEYDSVVKIWPQLKKEKIESIRFCNASNIEYRIEGDFWENVNTSGYRERASDVVRWWRTRYKVPKEKLTECIKIIDKAIKKAKVNGPFWIISSLNKILIVTKKGKYIIHAETNISQVTEPEVYGREWESQELGGFFVKYCMPADKRGHFVIPEEHPVAILIFSDRNRDEISSNDSLIVWPPVVLFGDKKEAEKLLNRSFEPKITFEGHEWLDKILAAYEIALKDAKEKHYRSDDIYAFKGWIVFLTQDEFYWGGIGIDERTVFGSYIIESKQLKEYFDEIGLTKELLAGEPNKEN
jgi:hypothetical protein